jgi:hypothetical protein
MVIYRKSMWWRSVYVFYPPILRVLEKVRVHAFRQKYLMGMLRPEYDAEDLARYLESKGYENAILAWRDPGELLSMRKLNGPLYQYHIRLFEDGEVRCHYEHSSEGNSLGHVLESCFQPKTKYFRTLLRPFLTRPKGRLRRLRNKKAPRKTRRVEMSKLATARA